MFRVSAINEFGKSEPLESEKAYKIQPSYGKLIDKLPIN